MSKLDKSYFCLNVKYVRLTLDAYNSGERKNLARLTSLREVNYCMNNVVGQNQIQYYWAITMSHMRNEAIFMN